MSVLRPSAPPASFQSKFIPNADFVPAVKQFIDEGHTATFRVRGYSMRPFLDHGRDKVILAPCSSADIRRGDVVLAQVAPGCYVLHRVVSRSGDSLTLRGDGNVSGTESCRVTDVIGRAAGFLRKGRRCPDLTTSFKWRAYSALWSSSPLLRRLLLAFYRRVVLRLFPSRVEA